MRLIRVVSITRISNRDFCCLFLRLPWHRLRSILALLRWETFEILREEFRLLRMSIKREFGRLILPRSESRKSAMCVEGEKTCHKLLRVSKPKRHCRGWC